MSWQYSEICDWFTQNLADGTANLWQNLEDDCWNLNVIEHMGDGVIYERFGPSMNEAEAIEWADEMIGEFEMKANRRKTSQAVVEPFVDTALHYDDEGGAYIYNSDGSMVLCFYDEEYGEDFSWTVFDTNGYNAVDFMKFWFVGAPTLEKAIQNFLRKSIYADEFDIEQKAASRKTAYEPDENKWVDIDEAIGLGYGNGFELDGLPGGTSLLWKHVYDWDGYEDVDWYEWSIWSRDSKLLYEGKAWSEGEMSYDINSWYERRYYESPDTMSEGDWYLREKEDRYASRKTAWTQPKILTPHDEGYEAMLRVCDVLNARYPSHVFYVDDTYFDYGQNWMWTTILCRSRDGSGYPFQVLNPKEFESIVEVGDVMNVVDSIVTDKYWPLRDKYGSRKTAWREWVTVDDVWWDEWLGMGTVTIPDELYGNYSRATLRDVGDAYDLTLYGHGGGSIGLGWFRTDIDATERLNEYFNSIYYDDGARLPDYNTYLTDPEDLKRQRGASRKTANWRDDVDDFYTVFGNLSENEWTNIDGAYLTRLDDAILAVENTLNSGWCVYEYEEGWWKNTYAEGCETPKDAIDMANKTINWAGDFALPKFTASRKTAEYTIQQIIDEYEYYTGTTIGEAEAEEIAYYVNDMGQDLYDVISEWVMLGSKSASNKNATRHFTHAEMQELDDEIEGRELHNSSRLRYTTGTELA